MFNELRNRYFKWLESFVTHIDGLSPNEEDLLEELYATPYEYSSICPNDSNRKIDGYELRQRFIDECHETQEKLKWVSGPCSVLEMLVALADRCEKDIMYDPNYGDRTSEWFWTMLYNLGINSQEDNEEVQNRLHRWMNREYGFNGFGGLFPLEDPGEDQSKVEIWYQMNAYMIEKFGA